MGQSNSNNSSPEHILPDTVGAIQDEVVRHARVLSEIATLTYEEFQICLGEINALSRRVTDSEGKQLVFAVKKGTDSTVLWKGTIRIACVKLDAETMMIDSFRLLNLNQFLKIFRTLQCQFTAALQSSHNEMVTSGGRPFNEGQIQNQSSRDYDSESDTSEDVSSYHDSDTDSSAANKSPYKCEGKKLTDTSDRDSDKSVSTVVDNSKAESSTSDSRINKRITTSLILEEVDNCCSSNDKLGECCICLERKPDMMLPCTHAYCMLCIEQWNTSHNTCPICRETLDSTDDTWVISDIPGSQEISEEICSALMKLTASSPD